MGYNKQPLTEEEEIKRTRIPKKDEVLGVVLEMLGASKMRINCDDGNLRICRIKGSIRKYLWIRNGDLVLIKPWVVQSHERGDIVWRYTRTQANFLQKRGFLKKIQFT